VIHGDGSRDPVTSSEASSARAGRRTRKVIPEHAALPTQGESLEVRPPRHRAVFRRLIEASHLVLPTQRLIRRSAVKRRAVQVQPVSGARPPGESQAGSRVPSPRVPEARTAVQRAVDVGDSTPGLSSGPQETVSAKPDGHPGRPPGAIAEIVSVWSALYAFPAIFITTLDLPVSVKIFWLFCLLVPAGLITWFIHERPDAARMGQPGWRRIVKRALLPMAAVASVIIALFSVRAVEAHIPPIQSLGCVAVGSGNSDYAKQFQAAYASAGGSATLGCAVTEIVSWAGGYQQTLQGPEGFSMITAVDPARVVVLNADEYRGFLGIAGQGTSFQQAGYPLSSGIRLRDGSMVRLGEGDPYHPPSAMLKQDGGQWYWVSYSFWQEYNGRFGGPDGSYGYPTSQQEPFDNGVRQFFQHGWLFYRADTGVLTSSQYRQFGAGKLHPSPSSSANPPSIAPPQLRVTKVYDVDSDKGTSYDLSPNQHADQPFRSSLPFIDQVGVIVGLNPANNRHGGPHYLKIELLNKAHKVLSSRISPLANNVNTVVPVPDVRVIPGTTYYIRVTNLSEDVLGVYLNDPSRPGEITDHAGSAIVNGVQEPSVLSAYVEARTART